MTEFVKETVTTQTSDPDIILTTPVPEQADATKTQKTEYVIYYFLGALEILLAFRLVLKITGASLSSGFVGLIYGLSGIFVLPFEGIFRRGVSQGLETASVLEPSTIVAMIVYAILAWGGVKLALLLSGKQQPA